MPKNDLVEPSRWQFSEAIPAVDAEYCLNSRHRAAACTRCAAACPIQAISLADGTPSLEAKQCVSCGVCQVACPTDVFGEPSWMEAKLAQTVSQTPADVSLVCPLKAAPERTAAPVKTIVRHKRCLAALSVSDLLELAQTEGRTIWLDDNACDTCPLAASQQTLQASVASAQAMLQAMNSHASIELYSQYPELTDTEPKHRPLLDGMQPKISRRRLFDLGGSSTIRPAIANGGDETSIHEGNHPPQRVPLSRQRLVDQLRRRSPKDKVGLASAPFADVTVDEQTCSACGLCAHFCPTAALHFDTSEQGFTIRFRPGHCIGCDLCKVACPEDAVHIGENIDVGKLVDPEWITLVDGELAACSFCGAETTRRDDGNIYHSCRHGAGMVTALHDDAGLMADLLSRLTLLS